MAGAMLLAAMGALLAEPTDEATSQGTHRVVFTRIDSTIDVDGHLTEATWSLATPDRRFFEIYPGNVAAPWFQTEVRFLYDDRNIYVGIRAFDADPAAIRSQLTRRDLVAADQDYVEVLVDPQNARRTAAVFRTNAAGVQTDGTFNEDTGLRDLSPDLNFDVETSVDSDGWSAEFRIPLSSLRYSVGNTQPWAVVVYRNTPREHTITMANAPVARGSNCVLCVADVAEGIALSEPQSAMDLVPHITYARNGSGEAARVGIDAKWHARADTSVDLTLAPDFSQVEADDLQLSGNTRFALYLKEKRPFFLEGADLLNTPIMAVYTRAFSNPNAGLRITRRGESYEYPGLLLHDTGFVPQVGVSEPVLNTGLYFYPKSAWLIRVAPQIVYSEIDELGRRPLTRSLGPGISLSAARDTTLSVFWYPHAMDTTFAGSRFYNMYAVSLLSTPFSWMPQASLSAVLGQGLDFSTGEVVDSQTWQASIPLRLFDRLELRATLAYQRLNSRAQNVPRTRLLTEENSQLSAIWYFSRQLYASASFQDSRWATVERSASETTARTHYSSFLLSYQANWQTRYYAGFRNGAQGREVFGKLSYAFSR